MRDLNDAIITVGPPKTGKIFQAISAIMGEMHAIGRNRRNTSQGFNYRGIDDIYNELSPLLAKHGVFTVPTVLEFERYEKASKSGGSLNHVILHIQYQFFASDGSSFTAVVVGEGMDSGDKASNKAESVAHKYALTQVFTIMTEDPDPDGESHEAGPSQKPEGKPKPVIKTPDEARAAVAAIAPQGGDTRIVMLLQIAKDHGYSEQTVRSWASNKYQAFSLNLLNDAQCAEISKYIKANPIPKGAGLASMETKGKL